MWNENRKNLLKKNSQKFELVSGFLLSYCHIFKSFVYGEILMDYGGIDWGIKNAFIEIKLLLLSLSGSVSLLDQKGALLCNALLSMIKNYVWSI